MVHAVDELAVKLAYPCGCVVGNEPLAELGEGEEELALIAAELFL